MRAIAASRWSAGGCGPGPAGCPVLGGSAVSTVADARGIAGGSSRRGCAAIATAATTAERISRAPDSSRPGAVRPGGTTAAGPAERIGVIRAAAAAAVCDRPDPARRRAAGAAGIVGAAAATLRTDRGRRKARPVEPGGAAGAACRSASADLDRDGVADGKR
jgi:hypothetical protein